MADEIKTVVGNELIRDTVIEIEKEEQQQKKTVFFQAQFVENLIGQTITELKNQMDALFLIFFDADTKNYDSFNSPKKKIKAIKGSHLIFVQELEVLSECLEPYNDASLRPKHKAVRSVINEGLKRLLDIAEGLQKAKYINNHYVTQFAKEMCLLMTNFHVVFHEETPKKERSRIVREYRDSG